MCVKWLYVIGQQKAITSEVLGELKVTLGFPGLTTSCITQGLAALCFILDIN